MLNYTDNAAQPLLNASAFMRYRSGASFPFGLL
jgi:hypothetical protein